MRRFLALQAGRPGPGASAALVGRTGAAFAARAGKGMPGRTRSERAAVGVAYLGWRASVSIGGPLLAVAEAVVGPDEGWHRRRSARAINRWSG